MSLKLLLSTCSAAMLVSCSMPEDSPAAATQMPDTAPAALNSTAQAAPSSNALRPGALPPGAPPLRVATYRQQGPSMLARLTATVLDSNGCVLLEHDGSRVVPVFPEGSVVLDQKTRSFRYQGRTYRPGDQITVGGGAAPTSGPPPVGLALNECGGNSEGIFLIG